MKIGLVQTAVSEDIQTNMKKALEKAAEAASLGAKIVCLQELYRSPYFPQEDKLDLRHLAETVPGPSTETFSKLAKEKGIVVVVPIFETTACGSLYNSAVVIDADGKLMPTYRKVHIPHDPLFYEKSYFKPGDNGFLVHETQHGKVAALICYDQWYPEAARANVLQGADLLFYPTAIGWIKDREAPEGDWREAWTTIQRSHAIANGVHVAAVNRVGTEGKLRFWGSSFVADAFGNLLGRAGEDEEILIADIDLARNKVIQDEWGFLRNRRPDSYKQLV